MKPTSVKMVNMDVVCDGWCLYTIKKQKLARHIIKYLYLKKN